jgi:hypothetical protein
VIDAREKHERTSYTLGVPGRGRMPVPADSTKTAPAKPKTTRKLGSQRPQARGTGTPAEPEEVGAQGPQAGVTETPGLGAQGPQARGTETLLPLPTPEDTRTDQTHQRAGAGETPENTPAEAPAAATTLPPPGRPPRRGPHRPARGWGPVIDTGTPMALDGPPPGKPHGRQPLPAATPTGIELLDEHVAAYPETLPRDERAWASRTIERHLAEGINPETIRIALALLREDQKRDPDIGVGLLAKYIRQAQNGARPGQARRHLSAVNPNAMISYQPAPPGTPFAAEDITDEWRRGA